MGDDYGARASWAFCFLRMLERKGNAEFLMRFSAGIRKGWSAAACALLLTSLWIPAAQALPPGSTTSSTSKAKPTAKKKHRKTTTHSAGTAIASTGHKVASKGKRSSRGRVRGQQKIDSERAQAIQQALIREHYLTGEPTGTWNQVSEDAMRRYQADHGWQSKTVPDSRALITLGLGPSHERLLNPESAMTTAPAATRATSLNPVSHSASPVTPASKTPAADSMPATTPTDTSSPQ